MSAVGIPSVSYTEASSNRTKVNSKWDGIPESLKAKEAAQKKEKTFSQLKRAKLKFFAVAQRVQSSPSNHPAAGIPQTLLHHLQLISKTSSPSRAYPAKEASQRQV